MRHLTSLFALSNDDVREILALARDLKSRLRRGERPALLAGQVLTQVFEKPSLRTRLSFEAAMMQLGGSSIFLSRKDAGLEGREAVSDVARVIGGYSDIIALRTYAQSLIDDFARWSGKPVVNGLSDDCHPCQALADMQTIQEAFGQWSGLRLAYVGDGNNVAVSLAEACGHLGMSFAIGTPQGYELSRDFVSRVRRRFPKLELLESNDPHEAVKDADIVYTDVWTSMGQEDEKDTRQKIFSAFQVTPELMQSAARSARFMHCLPARRGQEVTDEVMDGPQSLCFPQAENRMHLAKSVLVWALG
ncbi:MAG: ornithine carbamoyltransferase [Planctomycetota bacterium]|nr:MAG: ornithine carbamoyltransferase [Planctomycetota bacterium]